MRVDLPFATERLRLREFVPDDAGSLYTLDHDPGVLEFLGEEPGASVAEYRERIEEYQAQYARPPGLGFFVAETVEGEAGEGETAEGEFVGWFCLRPAEEYPYFEVAEFFPGDLEIGYRLRPRFWGDGLATEGVRALTETALRKGVPRVVAVTREENAASRRVLEKCGFRCTKEHWSIFSGGPYGASYVRML